MAYCSIAKRSICYKKTFCHPRYLYWLAQPHSQILIFIYIQPMVYPMLRLATDIFIDTS